MRVIRLRATLLRRASVCPILLLLILLLPPSPLNDLPVACCMSWTSTCVLLVPRWVIPTHLPWWLLANRGRMIWTMPLLASGPMFRLELWTVPLMVPADFSLNGATSTTCVLVVRKEVNRPSGAGVLQQLIPTPENTVGPIWLACSAEKLLWVIVTVPLTPLLVLSRTLLTIGNFFRSHG